MLWKFMPDDWAKGISKLPAPTAMLYFVDGKEYAKRQGKEPIELTPYGLLCGILMNWFETEGVPRPSA